MKEPDLIRDELTGIQPTEEPRTYVCFTCRDKGVVLYEHQSRFGYGGMHSTPCDLCERGAAIKRGRAAGRIEGRRTGEKPNQRL